MTSLAVRAVAARQPAYRRAHLASVSPDMLEQLHDNSTTPVGRQNSSVLYLRLLVAALLIRAGLS